MLGHFQEAILLILRNSDRELTTTDIYNALDGKLQRRSPGAIYTALSRMESAEQVTRRKGPSLPERGGKARYLYVITKAGRELVREAEQTRAVLDALSAERPSATTVLRSPALKR